jgi:hypothetical protein
MNLKSVITWLFAISLAIVDQGVRAESVKLKIQTKECTKGVLKHPVKVSVAVFDAEEISSIVELALSYERSASRINEDGADKAQLKYVELRRRAISSHALARSKHLSAPAIEFAIPPVRQVVVFGFGETESDFRYARRVRDIMQGRTNEVVLNFSKDEECTNAR